MRIFTVKRVPDGEVLWEGIEFSHGGPIAMFPIDRSNASIQLYRDIRAFEEGYVIADGEFVAWTEELRA